MRLHNPEERHFASDNYAGTHPEVLASIAEANGGHVSSYGADPYSAHLQDVVRGHFGEAAVAHPVFGGTGANVVALTTMLPRWGAVITAGTAHVNTDENGAPERVSGIKLLPIDTPDGKLTPELIDRQAGGRGDEHRAQPLVVSVTQATELGTVYTPEELRAVCEHAHSLGMRVHLDGSRLANAAASLGVPLRALTTDAGVDTVSLGGTKNGLLFGEAVVIIDPESSVGLPFVRKYTMQLPSKMRFVSAQLIALYGGDLWLRSAAHANAMAARLRAGLDTLNPRDNAITFTQSTEANAVFAAIPADAATRLREKHHFYDWDAARGEVRWMTAWDTSEADVDAFIADIRSSLSA